MHALGQDAGPSYGRFYLEEFADIAEAARQRGQEVAGVIFGWPGQMITWQGELGAAVEVSVLDILKRGIQRDCGSYVLLHSHLGDDPTPSEADVRFTMALSWTTRMIDMLMLDHVVFGASGECYSFFSNRLGALRPDVDFLERECPCPDEAQQQDAEQEGDPNDSFGSGIHPRAPESDEPPGQ